MLDVPAIAARAERSFLRSSHSRTLRREQGIVAAEHKADRPHVVVGVPYELGDAGHDTGVAVVRGKPVNLSCDVKQHLFDRERTPLRFEPVPSGMRAIIPLSGRASHLFPKWSTNLFSSPTPTRGRRSR